MSSYIQVDKQRDRRTDNRQRSDAPSKQVQSILTGHSSSGPDAGASPDPWGQGYAVTLL